MCQALSLALSLHRLMKAQRLPSSADCLVEDGDNNQEANKHIITKYEDQEGDAQVTMT